MKFRGGRSRDKDNAHTDAPGADDYWGASGWAPAEPEPSDQSSTRGRSGRRGDRAVPQPRAHEEKVDPARAAYLAEMAAAAAAAGVGPASLRASESLREPTGAGFESPAAFVPVSSPPVREVPVWETTGGSALTFPSSSPSSSALAPGAPAGDADTHEWRGPLVPPQRSPAAPSSPRRDFSADSTPASAPVSPPAPRSVSPASPPASAPVSPAVSAPRSPRSSESSYETSYEPAPSADAGFDRRSDEASTGIISAALRALVGFSHLAQPVQADIDQVMRTLAEHDDWYVPVRHAERAWGQLGFVRTLAFPDAGASPVLNVFTDLASARLAEGQAIGVYGGPVLGADLMRSISSDLSALIVNPASPREEQWYIATGGFEIANRWGNAIAVERALANRGNGHVPAEALISHRYLVLVEKATHSVAEIRLPDIGGTVAACFTAMDRFEEFVASLPPPVRSAADTMEVAGPQLFDLLRGIGAAGVVVNAGSDDQNALTYEDIQEILQLRSVAP